MGDLASDALIGWENIVIAAVCFVVLVLVLALSLRGIGRGRRKARRLRETTREPAYRPRAATTLREEHREERRLSADDDQRRMEPSLVRADEPLSETVAHEMPIDAAPTATVDATALEQHLAYLSDTQADMARTLKVLKGQIDELHKAEIQNTQRLDETEQLLGQFRAEFQTVSALLEKIAEQSAGATERRAPRRKSSTDPVLPLDIPAGEQEPEEDSSLARARQAVEQLGRPDRRQR